MKRRLFFPLLFMVFFSCKNENDTTVVEKVSVSSEDEKRSVEEAIEKMKRVLIDPTEENLNDLIHPDLTYGHSLGKIEDAAEFKRVLLTSENDYKSYESSEEVVQVEGATAWSRHIMDAVVGVGEEDLTPHLNVLTIWVKVDGNWKLFARQAVKI